MTVWRRTTRGGLLSLLQVDCDRYGSGRLNLAVVSYKVCWRSGEGFVSFGGFPQQMSALAQLFTSTNLLILERDPPLPQGAVPILGPDIGVRPSPEPPGDGLVRKLRLIPWAAVHGPRIVGEIKGSDAVHAAVPGDIGVLGLLASLALRKLTFVRHCGTWGDRSTLANRFLAWLLPRVAGGRVVVMATGGGPEPPEPRNPDIQWIFSTSFSQAEYERIVPASRWVAGSPLRLVTVGRLTRGKNALACIEALPAIRAAVPGSTLEIVGDGPFRGELERAVAAARSPGRGFLHRKPEPRGRHRDSVSFEPVSLSDPGGRGISQGRSRSDGLRSAGGGFAGFGIAHSSWGRVRRGARRHRRRPTWPSAVIELAQAPERMAAMGRKARETGARLHPRTLARSHPRTARGRVGPATEGRAPSDELAEQVVLIAHGEKLAARVLWATGMAALARRLLAARGRFVIELHGVPCRRYPELPARYAALADGSRSRAGAELAVAAVSVPHAPMSSSSRTHPGCCSPSTTGLPTTTTSCCRCSRSSRRRQFSSLSRRNTSEAVDGGSPSSRRLQRQDGATRRRFRREARTISSTEWTSEQIRECVASGLVTIGAHSVSHPRLTALGRRRLGDRGRRVEGRAGGADRQGGRSLRLSVRGRRRSGRAGGRQRRFPGRICRGDDRAVCTRHIWRFRESGSTVRPVVSGYQAQRAPGAPDRDTARRSREVAFPRGYSW